MQRLKGKTILIGKEPGQGRLFLSVSVNGQARATTIGQPGSVPNCVSRCKPAEGTAHCKVDIDQNGTMVLTNLKPQNVTYVNGNEIASKKVQADSEVALGKDHFQIPFSLVIETAKKLVPASAPSPTPTPTPEPKQKYNIKHLEKIWLDYHESIKVLREKQKRVNLIRSGCGIFTMCAMPCIFLFGPVGYALTGIGIIGNLYSFIGLKNDNTTDRQEELTEDFQDHYICPKCGKYLPVTPYKLMKKQYSMKCPHAGCGAEFTE